MREAQVDEYGLEFDDGQDDNDRNGMNSSMAPTNHNFKATGQSQGFRGERPRGRSSTLCNAGTQTKLEGSDEMLFETSVPKNAPMNPLLKGLAANSHTTPGGAKPPLTLDLQSLIQSKMKKNLNNVFSKYKSRREITYDDDESHVDLDAESDPGAGSETESPRKDTTG